MVRFLKYKALCIYFLFNKLVKREHYALKIVNKKGKN
jgi:hypothetical protein